MCLLRAVILLIFLGGAMGQIMLFPQVTEAARFVNASYIVTCTGNGTSNVTWKGPDGRIISQNVGRIHVEEGKTETSHHSVLVFESIERRDKGNYSCTAVVMGQLKRIQFKLTVVKPIAFHGKLEHQTLVEGLNMMVRCEVTGDPPPNIVWQVKGKPLRNSGEGTRYQQMPLGLFITNVSRADEGFYQCRAYQVTPKTSTLRVQEIRVSVNQRPRWQNELRTEKVYGYINGIANITCTATGLPAPGYAWYRYNKTLDPSYTHVIHESDRSILQVLMKNPAVALGEYQCVADNGVGKIMKRFQLMEGIKPNPPARVYIQTAGAYNAFVEVNGNADNEDPVIGYRVQFAKVVPGMDFTWDQPEYQDVYFDGGSPYKIYNLEPFTEYKARVATRTASGLSDYSHDLYFTTSSAAALTSSALILIVLFFHLKMNS